MTEPRSQASRQAFAIIRSSGLLSAVRMKVYAFLYENGKHTRNEIDAALSPGRPNPTASRRLAEMVRMGVLKHDGKRECRISGFTAELFDVTDSLPVKDPKPRSRRQQLRSKVQEIEEALAGPGGLMPDPRIDRLRQLVKEAKEISQ